MLQHTCWWVDPWCFGAGAQQVGVCSLLSSSLLTCRAFPAARAVPPVPGNAFAAVLAWKERKHGQLKAFCSFTVFRSSPFGIAQGYCSVLFFFVFFSCRGHYEIPVSLVQAVLFGMAVKASCYCHLGVVLSSRSCVQWLAPCIGQEAAVCLQKVHFPVGYQ